MRWLLLQTVDEIAKETERAVCLGFNARNNCTRYGLQGTCDFVWFPKAVLRQLSGELLYEIKEWFVVANNLWRFVA